ncbi:MAG: phospholipase A [Tepidisphaeraceae bacterium]
MRPSIPAIIVTFLLYGYLGDLSENPDIADYLGYGDLRLIIGWRDGLQLATTARAGNDWDKWTVELSLSYPLRRFFGGGEMYLYGQYFEGYGESLVAYDERTSSFRFGLALVR